MKDSIYVVDPESKQAEQVTATTFQQLQVKEKDHLQEWLMKCPEALGEPLLFITKEFDKFEKGVERRLDLLLLDQEARIVVAELKLDASGTWADQQAIRYAAFCSNMTMDDALSYLARRTGASREESIKQICDFLGTDELPELGGEPRIILAAGSFADQQLTATVIWLRRFGLDISCIELTPYKYPGDEKNILLVPKTLIPLPEASEFQIGVERKERSAIVRNAPSAYASFFAMLLREYAKLQPKAKGPDHPSSRDYMALYIGPPKVHYEWVVRKRSKHVEVAIHFETSDPEANARRLAQVQASCPGLASSFGYEIVAGPWRTNWFQLSIHIPYSPPGPGPETAKESAQVMAKLVELTLPAVKEAANA